METAVIRLTDVISDSPPGVTTAPLAASARSTTESAPVDSATNAKEEILPSAWRPSSALSAVVAAVLSVRVKRSFTGFGEAKPIRLWVFSGGSNTVSLSVSRSQLVCASLFVFLLFFGFGFGAARYAGSFIDARDRMAAQLTANADAVEQVALTLNANTESEAEPLSLTSSEPIAEDGTAEAPPAASAVLLDQLQRVKRYEAALKKRAAFIDALLDDVEKLDFDFSEPSAQPERASRSSRRSRWGIGGGEESRAPVIRAPREAARSPKNEGEKGSTTLQSSEGEVAVAPSGAADSAAHEAGVKKISLLLSDLDLQLSRLASVPRQCAIRAPLEIGMVTTVSRPRKKEVSIMSKGSPSSPHSASTCGTSGSSLKP